MHAKPTQDQLCPYTPPHTHPSIPHPSFPCIYWSFKKEQGIENARQEISAKGRERSKKCCLVSCGLVPCLGGTKHCPLFLFVCHSCSALQDRTPPSQAPLRRLQNSQSFQEKKKINRFSKRKRPSKPTHCSLYHFRLLLHPHSQFQPLEFLFPSQRGQGGSLGSWTEAAQHPRGAILKADPSRLPGSRAVIPGTAAGGRKGFPCSISFHPTPSEDRSPVASSNQEMRAVQEIWGWEARRIHKNPSRFFWLALGVFLGHYPIRQYMIFTKQNVIFDFLTSSCTVCNFFS